MSRRHKCWHLSDQLQETTRLRPSFFCLIEPHVSDKHVVVNGSDSMDTLVTVPIDTVKTFEILLAVFAIFNSPVSVTDMVGENPMGYLLASPEFSENN